LLGAVLAAALTAGHFQVGSRTVKTLILAGHSYARARDLRPEFVSRVSGSSVVVRQGNQSATLPIAPQGAIESKPTALIQGPKGSFTGFPATRISGHLYLPLVTLADAFGDSIAPGKLSVPAVRLTAITQLPFSHSLRVLFALSKYVTVGLTRSGNRLTLLFPGVRAVRGLGAPAPQGSQLQSIRVGRQGGDLAVRLQLPSGIRSRLLGFAGPSGSYQWAVDLSSGPPAQADLRIALGALDGLFGSSQGGSAALAARIGNLLGQAGWPVELVGSVDAWPSASQLAQLIAAGATLWVRASTSATSSVTLDVPSGSARSLALGKRLERSLRAIGSRVSLQVLPRLYPLARLPKPAVLALVASSGRGSQAATALAQGLALFLGGVSQSPSAATSTPSTLTTSGTAGTGLRAAP
jgi:hypothetical protein